MPLKASVIDGFWQCLRPSFDPRFAPRPIAYIHRSSTRLDSAWRARRCLAEAHKRRLHFVSNAGNRTRLAIRRERLPNTRPATESTSNGIFQEGRTAQIEDLYRSLQTCAARGDVAAVTAGVNLLVKERKERPNLLLYSALILANVSPEEGSAGQAALWFDELLAEGIEPDAGICHDMLAVLAIHPDFHLRNEILDYMQRRWFSVTPAGENLIVAGMLREKQFEQALDRIDAMTAAGNPLQGWLGDMANNMLCAQGEIDEALRLLSTRFDQGDLTISDHTWYYFLDAASNAYHHEGTLYAWRRRVEPSYLNPPSGVCLNVLATAARHGDTLLATDVFRVLGNRATVFRQEYYEMLFDAYVNAGDIATAIDTLCMAQEVLDNANDFSTISLFRYARPSKRSTNRALAGLEERRANHKEVPVSAVNSIIDALVYQDDINGAIELYKRLHELCPSGPTTSTFNSLLHGCRKEQRKDLAMFVAAELRALGCTPDQITFDRLVIICLHAGHLADAWRYYDEMLRAGLMLRRGTLISLVLHTAEATGVSLLEREVAEMSTENLIAWLQRNWRAPIVDRAEESWRQAEDEIVEDLAASAKIAY